MWYMIIGATIIVMVILLYVYGSRMSVNHLFLTVYKIWHEESRSVETALRKGIENFTYRAPFNQLSADDIDRLVTLFAKQPNPRLLGVALQLADREGSVVALKDPKIAEHLAEELTKHRG